MADNTIDTLDIQISSSTRNATKALGNLVKKLKDVDSALGSVNTDGLRDYAHEIGRVSAALQTLSKANVSVPNLSGLTGQLRSLSKVNFSELETSVKSFQNLAVGLGALKNVSGVSVPKIDAKNINSIIGAINKFQTIDTAKVQPAINAVREIAKSMSLLSNLNFKDNGMINAVNALRRLSQADISKFDTNKLNSIAKSLSAFSTLPDISTGINRLVSSLAKLASAGDKAEQSAKGLATLGIKLNGVIRNISYAGEVSDSINSLIQALAKLAAAGNKTGQTASQLSKLAAELKKFFAAMKNAPQISQSTVRVIVALGQLAAAGGKASASMNSVSRSLEGLSVISSSLSNAMSSLANMAKSGFSAFTSSISNVINKGKDLKSTSFNISSLLKTVLGFKAASAVMNKFSEAMEGKGILEIGSDITEVENVVDVAFGSMADQAYKFASTATKQYGLSELAAKNYSGTMMAMLNASGVAQESAAKMSTTLAGLAGDLASFYNIDTDTAFYKLRAGISGEIEPLKQLGINLSVANLQEYALSQGITTAYNSMTQAQKTMLRYNYIMSVTSAQQGDFARTAGSWANQVRLLTLNIQSLASVIGQGLIAAVLPGIKALNALMSKLMQAAETFRNFMYVLMGKKIKGSTSGVVNDLAGLDNAATDLSNMENAGDDAASGLDNATSSAKALKKALSLLPFDELNQLTDNSSSSGSTPSTGTKKTSIGATPDLGLGGITDQIDDALNNEETPINKWAKKIRKAFLNHDWKGLGKTIADMINIGMQKIYDVINWKNVGPKITAFTDAFTKTFNSLVDNIDWNLMGRTLGAGLNTIVNTMNQLLDGIDWYNLGAKFGIGITGLVKEVNWTNLGNLIGNSFMKAWDMFAGLVNHLPYADIGKAFADLLNGVFEKINFTNIAHVLATGLNGAFDSLKSFTVNFKWDDLVDNITGGITTFMQQFKWKENGQKLEEFIDNLLTSLVDIANGVDWEAFGHNIGVFLSEIDWPKHLSQITTVLKEVLGGIWDGLGTTSAGTFIQAIATFTIGMKLMPFVNAIVKFFTGDSVLGILSTAVRGMLGPALTSAASTTIPAFGSSLAALVGTGGGIAIAVAGAVLLTKKLVGLFETMQGGNGMTTQYGGYLHDYAAKLNELTTITNDQSEALWKMIEKDEELGKSHDEMYSDMIEKLKEYGVSTDQAKSALEQYGAQAGVSAEFVDDMTDKIQALGSGFSESAGQIDMSSLSAKEAVSILSDTLYTLSLKGDEFSGTYVGVRDQLQNTGGSAQSANEALKIVYNALQNAGVPLDDLNKKLSKDFPSATNAVTTAVKNNVVGAQEKISSTMMTASADTEKATNKMVETTTDDFAEIQKQADNYMKGVDTSTVTYWGSSSREVTKNLRQMKISASTELGNMDGTVRSHFGSQYRIALSKWQDLGRDISSYIRGTMNTSIGSGINTVVDTIKRNFSDMYSVGQNAMQNLRNGIESIHINTPHISMDYTDWQEGKTHKWRYNSRVDWYAKGGLFNAASVIGVGEAGKEAVLPLTNKQAMKSIADSITGNMPEGSVGLSKEEMTQAVTQGVAMAMMNMNTGGSTSPQYISNTINLDGRAFAKVITKAQQDNNRRKNPSPAW
jgi:hypothetical protein